MAFRGSNRNSPPGAWDDADDDAADRPQPHHRNDSANSTSLAGLIRSQSNDSEWIFASPWDFLRRPHPEITLRFGPQLASLASLREGFIIYIEDGDSRLHHRIMVVLRGKRAFFTCLAMCRHNDPFEYLEDHWKVKNVTAVARSGGTAGAAPVLSEPSPGEIRVEMGPKCHRGVSDANVPTRFEVLPDTTIDVWNIWSVENTVGVHVLGRVEPASMLKLKLASAEMYWASLGLPQAPQAAPAVPAQTVPQQVPERTRAPEIRRERSHREPDRHGHRRRRRSEERD